jgi:hypothetical protein
VGIAKKPKSHQNPAPSFPIHNTKLEVALRWKALAFILVLISAGSALAVAPQGQGPVDVTVNVTCPQDLTNGNLVVMVNPWIYTRAQGEDATFRLQTNRPQENQITIEAKEGSDWPYPSRQQTGPNVVTFTGMNGGPGDYAYNIVISCAGDQVVIDPRMRVE